MPGCLSDPIQDGWILFWVGVSLAEVVTGAAGATGSGPPGGERCTGQ